MQRPIRCRIRWFNHAPHRLRVAVAGVLVAPVLAACGSGGGTPVLTWYINPDNGAQNRLAQKCTGQAGGRYRITTSVLPTDATSQREQLVRRLAAKDASIDLMSLDPPFVAEFANAGYLRPFDTGEAGQLTEGVLDAPIRNGTWEGRLVAAPFWANTQLLWYRRSVARTAGVDPARPDFTWQQMIDAAVRAGKTVGEQGARYEGYMVWINALVESGGGAILQDVEAGVDAKVTIDSPAGRQAAEIIGGLARSRAASPTLATDQEEQARALFQSDAGGFMLNWPYVYQAAQTAVKDGTLSRRVVDDIAWARYPRVNADQSSKPPFGGILLGVGAFGKHKDTFALDAVRCITSQESQRQYMLDSGNPAARGSVYDDPRVRKVFPMAPLIRQSINDAAPRPITPYYGDVSASVQRIWHPPSSVTPQRTPQETAELIPKVLKDKVLL